MKKIFTSLLTLSSVVLSQTIDIHNGWNLVGALDDLNSSNLSAASCVKSAWGYDESGSISTWKLYVKDDTSKNNYAYPYLTTIEHGKGFWAYGDNNAPCVISSDATAPLNQEPSIDVLNSSSTYTLLAWNDLGMHCMDGKDFSIFTILPPYNNLIAQLIKKDGTSNKHITSGVTLSYESVATNEGKLNTTSSNKTNFWKYSNFLFPNSNLKDDVGLTGNKTASLKPAPMTYNSANKWFEATGIPIMNYNDDNSTNYYPMVKVSAKDALGNVLATTNVVLPVSDEMDCKKCHASASILNDAKPIKGWVNHSDVMKDFKLNILRLHDQKHPSAISDNITALKGLGYEYDTSGLEASALGNNPILCASCHKSNALGTSGIGDAKPLTQALHGVHANVKDPINGLSLDNSTNRDACYSCHPGASTECLRGAMGKATGVNQMQCQSCHGTMSTVANSAREGWLDQPNCQSCHANGLRSTNAIDPSTNTLKVVSDTRFATDANTPSSGKSLYRFSTGHGDMQCSSCHGSTHAIYPTKNAQDNAQSIATQGHVGTINECSSCHSTMPNTISGGPHGMHSVGQIWVDAHEDVAENNSAQCTACHGSDYKGGELSKTFSARTFKAEHSTKSYTAGAKVGCYDCHSKEW